jgi:anti-sigma regulatory factor (Ser/Thr protein kinase)
MLATSRSEREVGVSDRIVLTIPTDVRFRSVATLVLGGIGSRAELAYERMDDLQLALSSALDSVDGDTATIEVDTDGSTLRLALGRLRDGAATDPALVRVLTPLVDEVDHESRDGAQWLTLSMTNAAS